ncbi:MAG TPA: hypothetical protein VEU74_11875 [Gemmatimonadales bacterium]|nr:hypothetical protein [Gemmatimonadales bacterium]
MHALTVAPQGTKKSRQLRRRQRISLAVTTHEKRAMRFVARRRGLRDARGRLLVGVLLRDQTLEAIVREYESAQRKGELP